MRDKDQFDAYAYGCTHEVPENFSDTKLSKYTYELYVEGLKIMDNIDPKYVPIVIEPFVKGDFDEICLKKVVRYKNPKYTRFCDPDCYKVKEVEDKFKNRLNKIYGKKYKLKEDTNENEIDK